MPEWVIVGTDAAGEPHVLVEWVLGPLWAHVTAVKAGHAEATVFRDRWRAKRQFRKLGRSMHPVCLRRDRL